MESGSLKKELLDYFQFSVDTPSASAFCQQRNKLLLEAFQFLFYEFNSCFSFEKKYKDYQLLACDGSDLNIARNPNDAGTYFQSQPTDRGFNQIHLNALFDRARSDAPLFLHLHYCISDKQLKCGILFVKISASLFLMIRL